MLCLEFLSKFDDPASVIGNSRTVKLGCLLGGTILTYRGDLMIKVGIAALHYLFLSFSLCVMFHALFCGMSESLHVLAAHFLLVLI
jgi:hypothetical protein